ncbi:MAG: carboxypeptidase-like regulatory domain-containing protein [Filimonas sp.]|nr:carboxypeptidase-like regulatory domain-containing protein [Filimonas sp.]
MKTRYILFLLLTLAVGNRLQAQNQLRGKVVRFDSSTVLTAVTVYNATTDKYASTDLGGFYKIDANPGDSVSFSYIGYKSKVVKVGASMYNKSYNIFMEVSHNSLDTVTVTSGYRHDSLGRFSQYQELYQNKVKLAGNTTPEGFGIRVSPISYFSKGEKQKRELRKRLEEQEKDNYIDYRFNPSYVAMATGLQGEKLITFMREYRPTYAFARKANAEDMMLYVQDSFKKYKAKYKIQ